MNMADFERAFQVRGFNPSEKIWVKMGSSSPNRIENNKNPKPPPRFLVPMHYAIPYSRKSLKGWISTWLCIKRLDFFPKVSGGENSAAVDV